MEPTRRDLFKLAGASAVGLALGCGASSGEIASAVVEPSGDRVTVAVWTQRSAARGAVAITGPDGKTRTTMLELHDGVGAVELDGLAPATVYQLAVSVDGATLDHRVRTAPADDDPAPARIAIIADIDPSPEFETDLFDQVVAQAPDLTIAIGDFPYTDNGPPAETLAEYRARHAEVRLHPPVRRLLAASAVRAIYDDHEFRNDWDAMRAAAEPARLTAALQCWDEFFPVAAEHKYRNWRWGAHLECFLLDCRRYRSANAAPDDASKTMLGAEQLAWILDAVARSTAPFKLIFTSIPLDFGVGIDHWAAYKTERAVLFDGLLDIPGILFVTADQHWFAAHRHAYGIREIQIGPVARGILTPGPPVTGVLYRAQRYNAGIVDVAPDSLTITGLGEAGEAFYTETFTPADLTPRRT